jgi:hypothetical protein
MSLPFQPGTADFSGIDGGTGGLWCHHDGIVSSEVDS